jgi:hypothetical protein
MGTKILLIAGVALWGLSGAATAKSAWCLTTDDGEYDCEFTATDSAGSFEISAPGKPTFSLIMDAPGVASGYADFGDGNVSLPGKFFRSESDPACWVNDATDTQICAW